MPDCSKCGKYTKYNGGVCSKCYSSKILSEMDLLSDFESKYANELDLDGGLSDREFAYRYNMIKGRIAET